MSPSLESRIAELEIRHTLQEETIEQLSRELVAQRQAVESLVRQMETLRQRLREITPSPAAPASEETPPPHY